MNSIQSCVGYSGFTSVFIRQFEKNWMYYGIESLSVCLSVNIKVLCLALVFVLYLKKMQVLDQ